MQVQVYKNLHRGMWSILNKKTRLVIAHEEKVYLKDCKFIVRKGGRDRVRKQKKKNVHAFVEGTRITKDEAYTLMATDSFPLSVTYDPYTNDTFMSCSIGTGLEPIFDAPLVFMEEIVIAVGSKKVK